MQETLNHEQVTICGRRMDKLSVCENGETAAYCIIDTQSGANVIEFFALGNRIIGHDPEWLANGEYTGCPVLYPTPNRIKDGIVNYLGRDYTQHKNGKTITSHGFVHDEPFSLDFARANEDGSVLARMSLLLDESNEIYESFPFVNRLTLDFILSRDSLRINYTVENLSKNPFGFGFALHPYFYFDEEDGKIFIPSKLMVESDENLMPTGRFIPTESKFPGIADGTPLKGFVSDGYFIRDGNKNAHLELYKSKIRLDLTATDELRHIVVYRPAGHNFVCIENQTNSPDFHNMHAAGHVEEANVLTAEPGVPTGGSILISVSKLA